MTIFKIILTIIIYPLLFFVMIGISNTILYRKVIVFEDVYRIPQRFIRKITMSKEEQAKLALKEYMKLRKFVNSLDLTLKEKESIIWNIERSEKKCIEILSENIQEETLKKLKQEI